MEWRCQSRGDCCRIPKAVSMTYAERRELEAVAHLASRRLQWRYDARPTMTRLVTGPCPFVTPDNRCAAYDVRPFNCRRFGCMRPDGSAESFDDREALARVKSEDGLIQLRRIQSEAQPWALDHGWKETQ